MKSGGLDAIFLVAFIDQGPLYEEGYAHAIGDASTDPDNPSDNGLSDFGRSVVEEMNRLGIMIDVSHVSDKSFFDILPVTNTPFIASHSAARSLCDHPRNLSDNMLLVLAE